MKLNVRGRQPRRRRPSAARVTVPIAIIALSVTALAQSPQGGLGGTDLLPLNNVGPAPVYIIPGPTELSTLFIDGSAVEVETETRWRFICGSDITGLTVDDLRNIAETHYALMDDGPVIIVDSGTRYVGPNFVYDADATVPADALTALATAEQFLETQFADEVYIRCTVTFQNMGGGGPLGSTGSSYVTNVPYTTVQPSMVADMDGDDVIQSWLPTGSTIPVRYVGTTSTVTNETVIDFTKGNYKAVIGSVAGAAGDMVYNSAFSWDYDPSNGVGSSRFSFVDVVIHETGHAMGFVSAADDPAGGQMDALDIYRFQRTDGTGDYNPDTYAEFQTTARLVDYNTPNDDHNSDLIDAEYRMSDGDPWQASHFREQTVNIGIMDPAFAAGETYYPDYYSAADIAMFDAIGFDYPICPGPTITQQPLDTEVCAGDTAMFSVTDDGSSPEYQWRIGTTDLVDDGVHIVGSTTATLLISDITGADAADTYNCVITDTTSGCNTFSDNAALTVDTDTPVITTQPVDATADVGGFAVFTVAVVDPFLASYQWRQDGTPMSNGGRYFGTDTATLQILDVQTSDAADYDCVITSLLGAGCSVTSDIATLTVNGSCLGDLDGDGDVDLSDLSTMLANYPTASGASPEDGDLDGDGDVDLSDLSALLAVYGGPC